MNLIQRKSFLDVQCLMEEIEDETSSSGRLSKLGLLGVCSYWQSMIGDRDFDHGTDSFSSDKAAVILNLRILISNLRSCTL